MNTGDFSSPPCLLHPVDDRAGTQLTTWKEIAAWCKALSRVITEKFAFDSPARIEQWPTKRS